MVLFLKIYDNMHKISSNNRGNTMAGKNNANIGFEKQIWEAACELWGHIPAADYRKVIVGLIFLRYISSAFEKRYQQLLAEGDGLKTTKTPTRWRISFLFPKKRVGKP